MQITFAKSRVATFGVPYIMGYINNEKELQFTAFMDEENHFEDRMIVTKELSEKFRVDELSYTEIIKQKQREEIR
ncbi:DUF1433 domain-containing protein [Listeria sp. FSL L7-1517]|nr:DUF1433 domain-containing protein [Listeria immobilis]